MEYYKCSVCGAIHPIKKYYSFDGYQGEKPEYVYCCLIVTIRLQHLIRQLYVK